MKYLRGFNESNDNKFYYKISYDHYRREFAYGRSIDISDEALSVINKHKVEGEVSLHKNWESNDDRISHGSSYSVRYYSIDSNTSNDGWIIELKDEWFIVMFTISHWGDNGYQEYPQIYLCDQLNGLDKFLDDFNYQF